MNTDRSGGDRTTLTSNLGPRAPHQPDQNLLGGETHSFPVFQAGFPAPSSILRGTSLNLAHVSPL